MKLRESDTCVICGTRKALTRDHIPPKNLFPKPRPNDLITVPACNECNNGASEYDEDFRTYLSFQVGHETEKTNKLWEHGARKSILRRTSTRQKLIDSVTNLKVRTENGIEKRLAFSVPVKAYDVVFNRVVRGLYFHHTGHIISNDIKVSISPLYSISNKSYELIKDFDTYSIGGNSFVYKLGISAEDPTCSIWIMQLYEAHWILGETESIN